MPKKSLSFFNRAPSDTLKVFFGKIIYYFFSTSTTSMFCINSRFLFRKYTDVIKKVLFISVKYFKICISKSFMRPRFLLFTLYRQVWENISNCLSTITSYAKTSNLRKSSQGFECSDIIIKLFACTGRINMNKLSFIW